MGVLTESLKKYLASASKEQLQADWEELKSFNEFGPDMLCLLDNDYLFEYDSIEICSIEWNSDFDSSNDLFLAA